MGCDIHGPWVEQKIGDTWRAVAEFHMERCYFAFALMAGVRAYGRKTEFSPRGVPFDASWQVAHAYTLTAKLNPETQAEEEALRGANKWLDEGWSTIWSQNNYSLCITHPDYHSGSWLTAQDLMHIIECYKKETDGEVEPSLAGIAALIREIETPKSPCRLVFWFDN